MQRVNFRIGTNVFSIEDLDNQTVNGAFIRFYENYIINRQLNFSIIESVKDDFFNEVDAKQIPFTNDLYSDCKARFHDGFFNNFTIAWQDELSKGNYRLAIYIWEKAIGFAKDWESDRNSHIHKGTPLYFQSVTYLENDEIEVGFALMHEAYLEDYFKNNNSDDFTSPGKSFIEFQVGDNTAFYRTKLNDIKRFFENEFLGNSDFSFDNFKNDFSDNQNIPILIKYQFLLNLFRIWKSYKYFNGFKTTNNLVGLLYMESIFGLCRLIEPIYKKTKDPNPNSNKDIYSNLCGTTPNIFQQINIRNFGNSGFIREMQNILNNQTINLGRNQHSLSDDEKDILLSYGLRNLSAHDLYNSDFINEKIKEILQSIFRALFKTIKSYKYDRSS